MSQADLPFDAQFIAGSAGPLFSLWFPPVGESRGTLLCIPPFAEENNRCRVMMTMAARALASHGYGTLILDPYGTGDSAGLFEAASWEQWQADIESGIRWLRQKTTGQIMLWGIRLSVLLVAEKAGEAAGQGMPLLFWQPVGSGKTYFTQYLRLKVVDAANRGEKTSTSELREQFLQGEILEVGGYRISPELAAAIDGASLENCNLANGIRVDWLELAANEQGDATLGSRRLAEKLCNDGAAVKLQTFSGPTFWQLHERFLADQLITLTTQAVADAFHK